MRAPIIGITIDQHEKRLRVSPAYAQAIVQAGGIPVLLPPILGQEDHYLMLCDGFVFTGGNDPRMETWNISTHEKATPVDQERQDFELALLQKLQQMPNVPVLGVCLGMQWMGLLAGGILEQDLEEPLASQHATGEHMVSGSIGTGVVHTHHHQALTNAGSLSVIASADDGVIEAVCDASRSWYVGVQWHPERTKDHQLGQGLFEQLLTSANSKKYTNA